jgi:hypothetical protein
MMDPARVSSTLPAESLPSCTDEAVDPERHIGLAAGSLRERDSPRLLPGRRTWSEASALVQRAIISLSGSGVPH